MFLSFPVDIDDEGMRIVGFRTNPDNPEIPDYAQEDFEVAYTPDGRRFTPMSDAEHDGLVEDGMTEDEIADEYTDGGSEGIVLYSMGEFREAYGE